MKFQLGLGIFFAFFLFALSPLASAKDMANRLGVGYSDQFSASSSAGSLPSLAAQYYPNPSVGMSIALGVDTQKDNSRFGLLLKLFRVIFSEANLNFYMGGGAGLFTTESIGNSKSGFDLIGYIGAEYFFSGLENLGFSVEAGLRIRSDEDGARFSTMGDHPLRAGIIFYF